jgi:uncharacterized protein
MASPPVHEFRIRTITGFVTLRASDFAAPDLRPEGDDVVSLNVQRKIRDQVAHLRRAEMILTQAGYTVQTIRIATNPFGEWLLDGVEAKFQSTKEYAAQISSLQSRLGILDQILMEERIEFCSVGPAVSVAEAEVCILPILAASPKFSCSASLPANDVAMAKLCASVVFHLSRQGDGLSNFRFCVAAAAVDYIPFFPAAKAASMTSHTDTNVVAKFSIGLENGTLARRLLQNCGSIQNIPTIFATGMTQLLVPLQRLCVEQVAVAKAFEFVGIDTSLNPSLDEGGSVAAAMECLDEVVRNFGGPGTVAAAAAITQTLQSLPGIQHCGYSGIMLPVCEDLRLAELTRSTSLRFSDLLSISQVCGVGIDTAPIPADETSDELLVSLLLDVAGMAHRWKKSLSCRVFPVLGKEAGELTSFDSPYLVNAHVMSLGL